MGPRKPQGRGDPCVQAFQPALVAGVSKVPARTSQVRRAWPGAKVPRFGMAGRPSPSMRAKRARSPSGSTEAPAPSLSAGVACVSPLQVPLPPIPVSDPSGGVHTGCGHDEEMVQHKCRFCCEVRAYVCRTHLGSSTSFCTVCHSKWDRGLYKAPTQLVQACKHQGQPHTNAVHDGAEQCLGCAVCSTG